MKSHYRVIIIGGGSLGVSLLYHLAKEGWTDTLLIEKGELTSGSTWHAAGLCSNFIGNMTVAKIHQYSIELYTKILPQETGEPSPFHQTGSIRVGYSELEKQWFANLASKAKNVPCEFHLISQMEAQKLHPFMSFEGSNALVWTPNDGHVDPTSVVMPMSVLAKGRGATISRFNRVVEMNRLPSGEWQVITEKGTFTAEHVVNAAGCFASEVAAMVGATLPIVNLEHQYLVTEPHKELKKLTQELPVCRDSSASSYIRQEGQSFLVGPYETFGAKPWALDGMDWSFDRELFPGDLERLMPFLERCMEILPAFADVGVRTVVNGPITHSPDDNMLIGPQEGLRNFWNLNASSIGIAQGGIGKFMAQWMVYGQTELNMASLDSRRFSSWADKNYCVTKAIESYEVMYTAMGVHQTTLHARAQRISPLYAELQAKGAIYTVVCGYEKPLWFCKDGLPVEEPTWSRNNTFDVVANECKQVQQHAGIIDISGSSKFEIQGKDAQKLLDKLSCNKLPSRDGRMGLSVFHNENGYIMTEQSIARLNAEYFYLVGPLAGEIRDLDWMSRHADGLDVTINNCTSSISAVLLTGPKSREILQQLTASDIGNSDFPWLSVRSLMIDSAEVRVMRVSYAGELGYELHMPTYQLLSIYHSIQRVGTSMGLIDFGGYAFNSMRMEKAYRAWGAEFTEEISAVEAGMQRFIDTSKDFLGVESIKQRLSNSMAIQLAYLVFTDDVPCECFGNEAVYHHGELIGLTTGGAYGHRVGYGLAFAYVKPEYCQPNTELEVETSVGMRTAQVKLDAVYDTENLLLRQ